MANLPPIPIQRYNALSAEIELIKTRLDDADSKFGQILRPGNMALFPYRIGELSFGWYHMNGDQYALASPQGEILDGFSSLFKPDWGITLPGANIRLPPAYHSDGRGYFDRPVNGTSRTPGNVETDALQNIAGQSGWIGQRGSSSYGISHSYSTPTGPYATVRTLFTGTGFSGNGASNINLEQQNFDASRTVRTATETRSLNRGKTPAIYLGV